MELPGIGSFHFSQNGSRDVFYDLIKLNQWRIADGFEDVIVPHGLILSANRHIAHQPQN
jgi:hypothetical protein